MKTIIILLLTFLTLNTNAQKCDCSNYFDWLKQSIEENDAGATHTIENKGAEFYTIHNLYFQDKIKDASELTECTKLLSDWLLFFRKEHIGLYVNNVNDSQNIENANIKTFKPKTKQEIEKLKKKVLQNDVNSLEYIWKIANYTILIQQEKDYFVGYIYSTDNENWKVGEVKFFFNPNFNTGVYYSGDHSVNQISEINYLENIYLTLDDYVIEKQDSRVVLTTENELKYKIRFAENPFFFQLDEETIYLKLPSFSSEYKEEIDSLTQLWHSKLTQTKNLIIDVRNNGGGSDKTYNAILPYVYTNPILRNQIEFLSSKQNNQEWEAILAIPELPSDDKTLLYDFVQRLNSNIGGFEKIFTTKNINGIDFLDCDSVYTFPKNIAVVCNKNTGSAAEQFIVDVKQSWKVKIFGEQTSGALDVSNVKSMQSPDSLLTLIYSTSRYVTYNTLKIDDIGILPDFFINDDISDDKWLDFVMERMKN